MGDADETPRPCRVIAYDSGGDALGDFLAGSEPDGALKPESYAALALHANRIACVEVYEAHSRGGALILRRCRDE